MAELSNDPVVDKSAVYQIDETTGLPVAQTSVGGAARVTDSISLSGNAQASVALSTTEAVSAALDSGVYDVWCASDCYLKVATAALHTATPVTTSNGYLLRAGNTVPIYVPDQEKIGGIVASGTTTLYYHKVK